MKKVYFILHGAQTLTLPLCEVLFWGIEPSLALCLFLFLCTIPLFWPLAIAYLTWMFLDKAPEQGGRRIEWVRRLPMWKYFAEFFPISIVKVRMSFSIQRREEKSNMRAQRKKTWMRAKITFSGTCLLKGERERDT